MEVVPKVTYMDYPQPSPCNLCGEIEYQKCLARKEACDNLWKFLADRGDWVTTAQKDYVI